MWTEELLPTIPVKINYNMIIYDDLVFSDDNYIGIIEGVGGSPPGGYPTYYNYVGLKEYQGSYSTDWQYVNFPQVIDSRNLDPNDMFHNFTVYGWEKVKVTTDGENNGEIELWERHFSTWSGQQWTEWDRVGALLGPDYTFYLTHLPKGDGSVYGVQFRIRMKSTTGVAESYGVRKIELTPILSQYWYAYKYFEPQFPVEVQVLCESDTGWELPVLVEGDTPRIRFRIKQKNGEFVDLNDVDVYFKAKQKFLDTAYLFEKQCDIIDSEFGLCEVNLVDGDTQASGEYITELSFTYSGSRRLVLKNFYLRINPKL